jgi:hypothetical protein
MIYVLAVSHKGHLMRPSNQTVPSNDYPCNVVQKLIQHRSVAVHGPGGPKTRSLVTGSRLQVYDTSNSGFRKRL